MGSQGESAQSVPTPWQIIRESVSGSHRHDFTEGSIPRAVTLLAIPMVLEMAMESTFGLVDALFVSRLGKEAAATVGLTESMLVLIFGVALGLSFSTTAMVARRIGEKEPEQAAVAAVQAILLGILVAGVTGAFGAWHAPKLLALMGAEPSMIRDNSIYTSTILGSSVTIFLLFLLNAVFRGSGDAAISLRVLMFANAINILLNPCLILGLGPFPKLGLLGSAVATTIGRGSGVLFQFWILFRGGRRVQLARRHLRLDLPVMWRLLRVSFTGILQIQVATASWVGITRILATFGSAALAGNTFAIRMLQIIQLPAFGMSNAAATLVGQNLGANKPERAERAVWVAGMYTMIYLCGAGLVLALLAENVIRIFSPDADVIRYGATALRQIALGWPLLAWGIVFWQAFNGSGDTVTPSWINFFCYWVWQIPMAWLFARTLGFGPRGVYMAIFGTFVLLSVIYFVLFRRGRWKLQRI